MSTRVALGAVGYVVGAIYGYPQLGYIIGSTLGGIIDPEVIKGPSLGDLAQQTSQEGVSIPIVYGMSAPIAGNIIACSEANVVKKKSSGKGGPKVETESVYRTYAIGFCEGPISGFARVWRNNTKVYDLFDSDFTTGSTVKVIGGGHGVVDQYVPSRNEQFLFGDYVDGEPAGPQKVHFFNGTYDQDASPDLEAVFGVGTTPAHHGIAYMVVADEDLTAERGMVPYYQVQVSNATISPVLSNEVLYPWLSAAANPTNPLNTNTFYVQSYNNSGNSVGDTTPFSTLADALNAIHLYNARYSAGLASYIGYSIQSPSVASYPLTISPDGSPMQLTGDLVFNKSYAVLAFASAAGIGRGVTEVHHGSGTISGDAFLANKVQYLSGYFALPQGSNIRLGLVCCGANDYLNTSPYTAYPYDEVIELNPAWAGTTPSAPQYQYAPAAYSSAHIRVVRAPGAPQFRNATQIAGTFKVLKTFRSGDNNYPKPLNPCVALGNSLYTDAAYWTAAYNQAVTDGDIEAGRTYSATGTGDPVTTYPHVVSTAWQGVDEDIEDDGGVLLQDLVKTISARANVDDSRLDASLLDAETKVTGISITNQYPAYSSLQALGTVYKFDATKYDGKIRFMPRGRDAVATITDDDMVDVDGDDEVEESKRGDSLSVPRILHLNYYDQDSGGLSNSQQSSERAGDRRAVGESSIQSPIVMSADLAAQTVHIQHKVMAEDQKGQLKTPLPDKFVRLVPANNIFVQRNGRTERIRIVQGDILDGYQNYVGLRDRQSAYTSNVQGIPSPGASTPPSRVQGPTNLLLLDIPLLRDADDNVGLAYYIAVGGVTDSWTGCTVELSYDGGATYIDSQTLSVAAVIGLISAGLADHPADYPDGVNSFNVKLSTPGDELSASDLAGMLNGANLAAVGNSSDGWELINFAGAVESDPDTQEWTLSNLLRGRKNTATRAHAVDDQFVLLDRGTLGFHSASISDLGRTMTFRATTNGQVSSAGTVSDMVFNGNTQREYPAGYLAAHRSGSDMIASWQGAGRLGAGVSVAQGARFTGYRVTFNDGTNEPINIETTAQTLTQDLSSLGLDIPQLGDLAFNGDGDQNLQRMMVISGAFYATVGSGSAGSITATLRKYSAAGVQLASHALDTSSRVFDAIAAGGYIFIAYSRGPADYSRLSRYDPSTLLEVDHQSAAFATYQGVAYDGTWLYGSRNGASEVARFDTPTFGEDSHITVATPGRMSYSTGKLFAIAGANVSIIDTATFAEVATFATVSNPLDIMATATLVFVQGRDAMGVYSRTGTLLVTYPNAATITYEYQKFLATDGYRVFRPNGTGIEFFSGTTGIQLATRIEGAGVIGGFAGGYYIASQGVPEAMDGADTSFYASTAGIRVSVVQLNSLTGAGPATEVIA